MPYCTKSRVLAKKGNFRFLAECECTLPWPLSPRVGITQLCGVDLPNENACILTMRTLEGETWLGEPI